MATKKGTIDRLVDVLIESIGNNIENKTSYSKRYIDLTMGSDWIPTQSIIEEIAIGLAKHEIFLRQDDRMIYAYKEEE